MSRRLSQKTPQNRRSMLGFGSAASKLKKQTNPPEKKKLTFSANKSAFNSTGVGNKRWSSQGSHQFKDTRPLSNRTYQKQLIEEILEFLTETSYPHQISVKTLSAPTTKEFLRVFEHLYSLINPNFKMQKKFEEEIPRVLKSLKYPFPLSKSAMFAIGSLHTWPALLGALHWLMVLIKVTSGIDVETMLHPMNSLEDQTSKEQERLFFWYFSKSYEEFMEGRDNFTEAYEELEKLLMAQAGCSEEDHAHLMHEIDTLEEELEILESEPDFLEEALHTKTELEKEIANFESQLHGLDEKEQVIDEQKKILYQELDETGIHYRQLGDVSRQNELKHKSAEIKQQLELFTAEKERLEQQSDQSEIKYSKLYDKSSVIIKQYNNISETLMRKPYVSAYLGNESIMLNVDHTVNDMARVKEFKERLKPLLIKLSSQISEDMYHVEAQNITEKDKQDQLEEVLNDKLQEAIQLKLKLEELEKTYALHQESLESDLQSTKENLAAQQEYLQKECARSCEIVKNTLQQLEIGKLEWTDQQKKYEKIEDEFADFLVSYVQQINQYRNRMKDSVGGVNSMLREQIEKVHLESEQFQQCAPTEDAEN